MINRMKLLGSRSKGQHVNKDSVQKSVKTSDNPDAAAKLSRKKKIIKRLIIIAGAVILLTGACLAVVFTPLWDILFKPSVDAIAAPLPHRDAIGHDKPEYTVDEYEEEEEEEEEEERDTSKFTFLLMGIDGSGNTDVIMIASFDTTNYTLEIVSIPRDTMVNVSWSLKKVNSIHAVMRNRYRNDDKADEKAMQATIDQLSDILGFKVDFWATINMRGFISLIDSIGGIRFDVPVGMNWSDPELNMSFSLSRGLQTLSGQQALGLMRYRAGYSNADIGRINARQNFLKAAAEQILAQRNSINITNLAEIFLKYVKTDIPLNNLIWFGREFLKLSGEDINFTIMPGAIDNVGVQSYITIYVDEWLELINTKLNPNLKDITIEDLSILTRGPDRRLYVTDGNWQGSSTWGSSSRGPGSGGSSTTDQGTTSNPGGGGGGGAANTPTEKPPPETTPEIPPETTPEPPPTDDPGDDG